MSIRNFLVSLALLALVLPASGAVITNLPGVFGEGTPEYDRPLTAFPDTASGLVVPYAVYTQDDVSGWYTGAGDYSFQFTAFGFAPVLFIYQSAFVGAPPLDNSEPPYLILGAWEPGLNSPIAVTLQEGTEYTLVVTSVDTPLADMIANESGAYNLEVTAPDAAAVPEPSALWLAVAGVGLLGLRRLRRSN